MRRKGIKSRLFIGLVAASTAMAGILGSVPLPVKAAEDTGTYEAMIEDAGYEELEDAFANAKSGDTITVLKDCSVSDTLVIMADSITLTSGDAGNPATISRDGEFAGSNYSRTGLKNTLLGIEGSLTMHDIILDGGAELDGDFNNSGQTWDSPLIYVKGTLAMEDGTVLQNNYNTDGNESSNTNRTAGAIHVDSGAAFAMGGGLIQHCYTNGSGGGIQNQGTLTATAGTITECYARVGSAIELIASGSVSGMTISGNKARSSAVSIHTGATLSGCLVENNENGGIGVSGNGSVTIEGCTITGNYGQYASAISYSGTSRTAPLTIRGCTIRGNTTENYFSCAAIDYMTKADLILDGQTAMEGNTTAGSEAWDINFSYNGDITPIKLGSDFESDSKIVLWGSSLKPRVLLVDAASNGKEADASQFVWRRADYRTEEKEGNIYLAEIPVTYRIAYNANTDPSGLNIMYYDPNPYTSEDTAVIMSQEELLPYMEDIARPGYDFIGWNTRRDGAGTDYAPGQEIHLTEYLYLYAKWEAKEPVTITYIYNGGEGEKASEQVVPGINFTFPDASRKGYSFKGWYEDEDLAVFAGNAGEEHTAPEQDTSYYAAWEKTEATVTFDADGGEVEGGNITAKIGDSITLPDCTKDGYEFVGWYDGDSCVGQAGEDYTVTDDVTLKAHYERKKATITFDADGGKMEGGDITANIGDDITLPDCTKDGYEFVGWYDGDSCVGQAGEEYTVSDDVTLKAHYVRKEAPTCTVSFDTDGGKEIAPIKAEKGQSVKLPEAEKEGHIFLGWYTAKEGGSRIDTGLTVTEDIILYARWEKEKEEPEERPEATITFDADGGTMEGGDITAKIGDSITLPDCTKDGYEFVGWYDNDTCVGQAGETYPVTGDVILKAHYEKKEEKTYTVIFDANGGKEAASVKAAKGEKIKLPGTERSGYVFLGWYTEKENGILLGIAGDEMEVTKDMTVYALWEQEKADGIGDKNPETCRVVFHTEGGTLKNETITIVKGASLYLPLPEKEDYGFTGWYLDQSLTQFAGVYRDSYCITKDTDFYAKWEKTRDDSADQGSDAEAAGTYTVKYDANGGTTKETSAKVAKGASVKLPTAEREGFTFKGWYTDEQVFVGKAGDTYKPDRDISLYAGWEKAASSNDSDNDSGDNNAAESGSDSDTESGTSADTFSQGENADASVTEESGNTKAGASGTGAEKEPVIQTGRTSPIYLLAALGMFGILLAALSIREGKHCSEE